MKSILIALFFVNILAAQTPEWFGSTETGVESYKIVGYGSGESIDIAKTEAKDDISKSIRTTIKSLITSRQERVGDDFESSFAHSIEAKNSMTLTNVELLRQEEVDGVWYVALSYDNRVIEQKIADSFKKSFCVEKTKTHPYIAASPLYKNITRNVGCQIDLSIIRQNGMWYLKALDGEKFAMAPLDFEKLFYNRHNEALEFHATKETLKDGDEFSFDVKSAQSGYVTLLTMYENGIVTVLEHSRSLSKNKKTELPSPEKELVLEAATLEDGSATYDLYIALFSKSPIDTGRFDQASEELATSEKAYKFDELLDLMQEYSYATISLTTNPR